MILTKIITGEEISKSIESTLANAVVASDETAIWVSPETIDEVCKTLKNPDGLD